MSAPAPSVPTPPTPPAKKPLVVVPGFTKRDVILGIVIALAVLGLIVFAILHADRERPGTWMDGTVVERYQTGQREVQYNVSRSKGVEGKVADTGYYLKVKTKDGQTYDVMVSEQDWQEHDQGTTIGFLRPR